MRARVLAGIFIVAALGWLVVRAAGDAGAAGPSTIARGLPGSAVAYVEVDDVGALLRSWTEGSRLEKAWRGSDAKSAFEKTFVYLRLVDRLGKLEELGGFTIDAAALAEIFGRGGGLAVYDVSDTTFVAEAKLSAAELAKTRLSKAWASLPHRSFAGVDYVIGEAGGKSLLIAQVGARLVASNSVDRFHEALVLSAREEKVKTDGSEKPVASLGDDEVYVGLVKVVPASARVRVFARLSELRGTHQFDDFWVFGKESRRLAGLDAAMLALTISKDEVREDRFWAYGEGSKAPATGGRVDVVQTAAKLPAGGLWVGTELTDGRLAAERIVRLLPSEIAQAPVEEGRHRRRHHADEDEGAGAGDAGDKAAAEPAPDEPPAAAPLPPGLAGTLTVMFRAAGVTRMMEIVTLDTSSPAGKLEVVRRGGAVVVRFAGKLDRAALEKALTNEIHADFAAGTSLPLAFADAGGLRTLAAPFVDEWGLTLASVGDNVLVIATDAKLAASLVAELQKAGGAVTLLADGAPTASRLDLAAAAKGWDKIVDVLDGRQGFAGTGDEDFVEKLVPSALSAAAGAASVVSTAGWTEGGFGVEEMVAK